MGRREISITECSTVPGGCTGGGGTMRRSVSELSAAGLLRLSGSLPLIAGGPALPARLLPCYLHPRRRRNAAINHSSINGRQMEVNKSRRMVQNSAAAAPPHPRGGGSGSRRWRSRRQPFPERFLEFSIFIYFRSVHFESHRNLTVRSLPLCRNEIAYVKRLPIRFSYFSGRGGGRVSRAVRGGGSAPK